MAAWWERYQPGGIEAALKRRERERQKTQSVAIAAHFREQEARREAERQREQAEAEALRERLREQRRGGKLAWAARLRETPQMRAVRLASEAAKRADGGQ